MEGARLSFMRFDEIDGGSSQVPPFTACLQDGQLVVTTKLSSIQRPQPQSCSNKRPRKRQHTFPQDATIAVVRVCAMNLCTRETRHSLAKALATIFGPALQHVVDPTQTAFVPGRWVSDNVLCHLEEMEYLQQTGRPGCMVFWISARHVTALAAPGC